MHKSIHLHRESPKTSCDNEEAISLIRNTLEGKKANHSPYIGHVIYNYDIFEHCIANPAITPDSYDKISIFLLPLKWEGITHNCKDPLNALSPQLDNEKFEQIHGNKEAIIVDAAELKTVYNMLDAMRNNYINLNNTIEEFHNYHTKHCAKISSKKTLEPPKEVQHKPDQDVDCEKQDLSAAPQPMKRDATTQTTETDIEISSAIPQPIKHDAATQTTETDIEISSTTLQPIKHDAATQTIETDIGVSSATLQSIKRDAITQTIETDIEISSTTLQPIKHDAATQITETDIGFSSVTPLMKTSSDITNADKDVVFSRATTGFCIT